MWTFSSVFISSSEGESLSVSDASMENEYGVNIVSLDEAESQSESTLCNSLESGLSSDADLKKLDECGGWTNEKHNSYLEYLENSFVKHLYSFLGGDETQRLSRTREVQSNSLKSTDQFTVLQNGCLQKVNFGKKRAHFETSSQFHSLKNSPTQNKNPAQSTAEASGQNFREEVGEKGYNSGVSRKRRREANYDDSSLNDQVVP